MGLLLNTELLSSCSPKAQNLNILILGGTYFVGPAIVNTALEQGHRVTLFNRGQTNPTLFPDVKLIKGDRELGQAAYEPLLSENWDVVIDVWPEKSSLVDDATAMLAEKAKHYIFISSIAVYNDFQEVGLAEKSKTVSLPENKEDWSYSEEKLAAEQFVSSRFPKGHTIIRPGPIKGWRDPALDLLYWCLKLKQDAAIIAPGTGADPLQFIDVKDVASLSILAAEKSLLGTYNCTGPQKEKLLWREFLDIAKDHFQSDTELIWADEGFLSENQVRSFSDLPLWAPLSEDKGFMQISNQKLLKTGFKYTPIQKTLDDCLEWYEKHLGEVPQFGTEETGLGLDLERELELIQKLEKKSKLNIL